MPGQVCSWLKPEFLQVLIDHLRLLDGSEALGAQSIMASTASLVPDPILPSVSTSTSCGEAYIGASLLSGCIIARRVSFATFVLLLLLQQLYHLHLQAPIVSLFTDDPAVLSLVAATLPFLAFMQFFDAFNASTAGCVAKGDRKLVVILICSHSTVLVFPWHGRLLLDLTSVLLVFGWVLPVH